MIALADATDAARFGRKAAALAAALRAGLPVPPGLALDVDEVAALAGGRALSLPDRGTWAVRSSAIDEDSARASFAGQYLTRLNVRAPELARAILDVSASATSPGALAYRQRLGRHGTTRMAVIVQEIVPADIAGVLFTRDPVTAARERVIEAAWGLGEAVVAGLVTPDAYRLSADGRVLERRTGRKDIVLVASPAGGVEERAAGARASCPCLDDEHLARLHALACDVERAFDGDHDLEWAFAADALYLLQRRPITR